jgi:hypothetical protein
MTRRAEPPRDRSARAEPPRVENELDLDGVRALGAALVVLDTDAIGARRVLTRGQAALASPPGPAVRWIGRWIEPAIVVGLAASYLMWALETVIAVYR